MTTASGIQAAIHANRLAKGFNVIDVGYNVGQMLDEVDEFVEAWCAGNTGHAGEELADVAIFDYGLAEMTGHAMAELLTVPTGVRRPVGSTTRQIVDTLRVLRTLAQAITPAWEAADHDLVGKNLLGVMLCLSVLARAVDVDLDQCIQDKVAVNARRRYEIRDGVHVRVVDGSASADLRAPNAGGAVDDVVLGELIQMCEGQFSWRGTEVQVGRLSDPLRSPPDV